VILKSNKKLYWPILAEKPVRVYFLWVSLYVFLLSSGLAGVKP